MLCAAKIIALYVNSKFLLSKICEAMALSSRECAMLFAVVKIADLRSQ